MFIVSDLELLVGLNLLHFLFDSFMHRRFIWKKYWFMWRTRKKSLQINVIPSKDKQNRISVMNMEQNKEMSSKFIAISQSK